MGGPKTYLSEDKYSFYSSIITDIKYHVVFSFLKKVNKAIAFSFILFFSLQQNITAQNSGAWTASGSGASTEWNSTAGSVGITLTATDYSVSADTNNPQTTFNDFLTGEMMACSGAYSEASIFTNPSLSLRHTFPNSAFITFTFSTTVINPVINIDRLGGGSGGGGSSTSSLLKVVTSGITLTELSQNNTHFVTDEVNQTITRESGTPYGDVSAGECGLPADDPAAGSVRLNGTFSTVTFEVSMNPDQSATVNDRFEIAFSNMVPDSDGDGVPDASDVCNGFDDTVDTDNDTVPDGCDLDDDNDGILDDDENCNGFGLAIASTPGSTGTISDGIASVDFEMIGNSSTGYGALSYDMYNTGNTNDSRNGIEYDYAGSGIEPDEFNNTTNFTNPTSGYTPQIRITQSHTMDGNFEASELTISWVGGTGNATYYDNATPSTSMYRFTGAPNPGTIPPSFDLNNRQIEGVDTVGSIPNGGSIIVYAIYNSRAEWYIDLPLGVTSVTINKRILTDAVRGLRLPIEGEGSQPVGASSREWVAFSIPCFVKDTDNDGIANSLDTDSDNDGCPDAVEGAGDILSDDADLTNLAGGSIGGSLQNLGTSSDAEGNPIYPSSGSSGFEQGSASAVTDDTINACLADLSLMKTVDKAIVKSGDTIIYTLTIKNDGLSNATGVQVTDVLPTGITYNSHTVSTTGTTFTDSDADTIRNLWNIGNLAVNQTISLQITATVSGAGTIVNTAEITQSNQTDSDSIPNNGN